MTRDDPAMLRAQAHLLTTSALAGPVFENGPDPALVKYVGQRCNPPYRTLGPQILALVPRYMSFVRDGESS